MILTAVMRAISSAFTAYAPPRFRRTASFYIKIFTPPSSFVAPAVVVTRSGVPDPWGLASEYACIGTAGVLHLNAHTIKTATF
jgi:hypothetical protein